jgi:hypothetical protein
MFLKGVFIFNKNIFLVPVLLPIIFGFLGWKAWRGSIEGTGMESQEYSPSSFNCSYYYVVYRNGYTVGVDINHYTRRRAELVAISCFLGPLIGMRQQIHHHSTYLLPFL